MSNMPRGGEPNKEERSSPLLFVIVLLLVVAGIVAFISLHSSGGRDAVAPSSTAAPAPAR